MNTFLNTLQKAPAAVNPFIGLTAALWDNYLNDDILPAGQNESNVAFAWSRPIREVTELGRERLGWQAPVGGWDINATARDLAGYDENRPSYEEDRIVARIADRVRLGEITKEEADQAVAYQDGDIYDEALSWTTRFYGDRGLVSFTSGFYPSADPHTEIKALSDEYWRLKKIDPEAAERFGDENPAIWVYNQRDRDWRQRRGSASQSVAYDTTSYLRETIQRDYPEVANYFDRMYDKVLSNDELIELAEVVREAIRRDPDEQKRKEFEQRLNVELDALFNYNQLDAQYDSLESTPERSQFYKDNPQYEEANDWRWDVQQESGLYPRAEEVWGQREPSAQLLERARDMGIQGAGLSEMELEEWIERVEVGSAEIVGIELDYIDYLNTRLNEGDELTDAEKQIRSDFYEVRNNNMSQYDYDQMVRGREEEAQPAATPSTNAYSGGGSSGGSYDTYTQSLIDVGVSQGLDPDYAAWLVTERLAKRRVPYEDFQRWEAIRHAYYGD
jgi:hypothetical protein